MSIAGSDEDTPPRPQPYLRIGVTGHRLGPKLSAAQAAAVRTTVDGLLADIARHARAAVAHDAWAFTSSRPVLSTVSALAEGADRIVAEAGLVQDLALNVILPFPRADYRTDFAASAAHFDAILAQAGTVFELDGRRDTADRAYEAAGLLMLANADIVVAVWDQEPAAGLGGTALIVEHAVQEGVPVILIDPRAPADPCILWRADMTLPPARPGLEDIARRPVATLERIVAILMAPPAEPAERGPLETLYGEHMRRWNISLSYPLLLAALGVRRLRWTDLKVRPADPASDWQDYLSPPARAAGIAAVVTDTMLRAYSFVDHLSTGYGQVYRSAYVFNFAMSALAVFLALSGLLLPGAFKPWLLAGEIVLIALILWVIREGTRRQWHRRWLEYRRLAETFRHLRILALTGAAARIDRPGWRSGRGTGWVDWYARAVEREIPLPNVVVDQAYLAAVRDAVRKAEIVSQIAYNRHNAHVMEEAGERMHHAGSILFGATFLICVGFLLFFIADFETAERYRFWAVFLTALFPTVGAALNAIKAQGDFQSVALRAHETAVNLEELDDALANEKLDFARLADRLEKSVDVLMADNAEWHVLFRTRPLSLPA